MWTAVERAVTRHAGRTAAMAVGLAALVTGVVFTAHDEPEVPWNALIVGGLTLFGVAALLPYIKRFKGPWTELETRDETPSQLGREVIELRETKPAPETTDLPGNDWWEGARYRLGERALEALLTNLSGNLAKCEARIFLFDATRQLLVPALSPPGTSGTGSGWAAGEGVTGFAYERSEYVFAKGRRCSDGTFGLSEEKQRRYTSLTEVAAMPLQDPSGRTVGTLSLSSKTIHTTLTSPDGRSEHVSLAQQVSVALRELIGYKADGTIPGNGGHT